MTHNRAFWDHSPVGLPKEYEEMKIPEEYNGIWWSAKFTWVRTNLPHVWFCIETRKYHFSDEASLFDETPYNSIEECTKALSNYCESL